MSGGGGGFNNILSKIRSNYTVKRIFDNLNQNKLMNLIRYNSKNQKLMNIKLKDYKNIFSTIEIEIIPKQNEYGKFINYLNKNINIYFNDNEEEVKKKIITKDDKVTKIKIILNNKIKSLSSLFYECKCIEKIDFVKFNKNNDNINDMSYMFYGCSSLKELNLSKFNTSNVFIMNHMFDGCSSLKELNLYNFNTNNVKNMTYMFFGCSSLKESFKF